MLRRVLAGFAILASFACCAQETSYTSVVARAGQTSRIAYYADITSQCTLIAPRVAVVSVPKHGTLTVKSATLKTKQAARCGEIQGPASVLFYTPHGEFSGDDFLAYVITTASKQQRAYSVNIKVLPADGKSAKPI